MRSKAIVDIVRTYRIPLAIIALLLIADAGLYLYRASLQKPRLDALYATWSQKRHSLAAKPPVSEAEVYRRGVADMAAFNAAIAPKREFVRLIGDLYDAAGNNGLTVGAITYKSSLANGGRLLSFAISMQVSGKYAGIKSFIGDIARSKDMTVIDDIALASGGAMEESVKMQMEITAYLKPEGQ